MKNVFKKLAIYLALFIGVFGLASCGGAFKDDWGSITYTDDNYKYVTKLTLDEAKTKKNNNESFVLIYADPSKDDSKLVMQSFFDTIVELGFNTEDKIYYINSSEAITRGLVLAEYKQALGVCDMTDISDCAFVVQGFEKGKITFDTSKKNSDANKRFLKSGSTTQIDYYAVFQYILIDLKF